MEYPRKHDPPFGIGRTGRSRPRAATRQGGEESHRFRPDRRSLSQLRLHPDRPHPNDRQSRSDVSIDFTDETSLLNAETLDGYKVLIVLRDGMIWPDGYGGDESTNAAWVATGRPKLVFDPPTPQAGARSRSSG